MWWLQVILQDRRRGDILICSVVLNQFFSKSMGVAAPTYVCPQGLLYDRADSLLANLGLYLSEGGALEYTVVVLHRFAGF